MQLNQVDIVVTKKGKEPMPPSENETTPTENGPRRSSRDSE